MKTNVTLCIRGLATGEEILWQSPENALDWMQEQEEAGLNEEFIITDYEAPFSISEYDNIEEVIEKAEQIENLEDYEIKVLEMVIEHYTSDFDEALDIVTDGKYRIWENCDSMKTVAENYCYETGILDQIPDDLRDFFDYEAYGRYLETSAYSSAYIFYNDEACSEYAWKMWQDHSVIIDSGACLEIFN